MEMQSVYVHTNAEIVDFINENKLIIFKACKDAELRRCDWDSVLNNVAGKYAEGKIMFNPTRGVKYVYIHTIAYNAARDVVRKQHQERFEDFDDKAWENIRDEHRNSSVYAEDIKIYVKEALRRLAKEMRDKMKIELLVRYVLKEEEREQLAREYEVENDFVSLVKNRYLPRLQKYVREVMKNDENGRLVLGDESGIKFLKPYLNW